MTEQTVVSTADILFPSKGMFYEGKMPEGKAEIRAWTTAEIKLLVSAKNRGNQLEKALDRVIDNCLRLPAGLKHEDLLYTDGFYALIAQHIFTYDPKFKSEFKCGDCDTKNEVWIDLLQDLSPITPDEGTVEPIEVMLPVSAVPVTLRLLRRKDTTIINKYSKQKLDKSPMAAEFGDPGFSYRLALQTVTVDGEKVGMGEKVVWVDQLHARDLMALEGALEDVTSGVDPVITKQCCRCGEESKFVLPMNIEFFRPRSPWPGDDTEDAS